MSAQHTAPASPRPVRRKRATKGSSKLDDYWHGDVLDKAETLANKRQKTEAPLDPEDGPGHAAIGRRVTVWWPEEDCDYTGTITKFDRHAVEYCVRYEGDEEEEESIAWHEWDEIRCEMGDWRTCSSPRTRVLEDLADHLVCMASTIRGTISNMHGNRQCTSDNNRGGLAALQSAGKALEEEQVQPKGDALSQIAQTLQHSMNQQIKAHSGQPATTGVMKTMVHNSMTQLCQQPHGVASVSQISTLTLG